MVTVDAALPPCERAEHEREGHKRALGRHQEAERKIDIRNAEGIERHDQHRDAQDNSDLSQQCMPECDMLHNIGLTKPPCGTG